MKNSQKEVEFLGLRVSQKTANNGLCGCAVFWIFLILILTSLARVQFNEYGFRKPWGQPIDQSKVYNQGVYFLGFWNRNLVTFPADLVELHLNDMSVFSESREEEGNAGTTLVIDVSIQYKLNPTFLSDLFDIGGKDGYISQIEAVSLEEIKNNSTTFSADFYLTNRREIENSFRDVLDAAIFSSFAGTEVVNVELLRVVFPDTFYKRKLDVGLQEIQNDIQQFNRNTTLVRDVTKRKVLVIENEAKRIEQIAEAEAALIVTKGQNEYNRIIGEANELSIGILADALNITEQKDFLSLNYLVQLLNTPGLQKKFVNFGSLPDAKSLLI